MAGMTPTSRSLDELRKRGYTAEVVERNTRFKGIFRRHDLFGVGDILALGEDEILLVQATSGSNVSARVKKIADSEHIAAIRKAGMRLEVWGWAKNSKGRWTLRTVDCS